ncbi:MAG: hypothetical protein LBO79_04400 [Zoogloeaceae bacterium]|jgi:hypothetical protein|nr:hypothetical protein [Zoogloeaceae bacterium]
MATPRTQFTGEVDIEGNMHTHKNAIVDINNINGANDIATGAQLDGAGNTNHHRHGVDGVALGESSVPVKSGFDLIVDLPKPGKLPSAELPSAELLSAELLSAGLKP